MGLKATIEITLNRHKTENRIKQREQWVNAILMSIEAGVIAADKEGVVTFMNPVAESLTGWNQEDAVGKSLDEIFRIINQKTRESCENLVEKVLKKGGITEFLLNCQKPKSCSTPLIFFPFPYSRPGMQRHWHCTLRHWHGRYPGSAR